tara:strand:- start:135 stop:368 length:234 start_codon:yes stop_codon:yes gene_type:complete
MPRARTIPAPKNKNPLIAELVRIMNDQGVESIALCDAAGIAPCSISSWRLRHNPTIHNFEAALNVLGYELSIRKRNG